MKSKITLAIATLSIAFLQSCNTMKYVINEKIETKPDHLNMVLKNNQVLIPASIEGTERNFALDMGAQGSVIYDTSIVPGYSQRKKATFGFVVSATGKFMSSSRLPLKTVNTLHKSDNKVFLILPNTLALRNSACTPGIAYSGLYGYDFFIGGDTASSYLFDFDGLKISTVTRHDIDSLVASGYQEIKVKINERRIRIYITVNGKEYPFTFDTGFTGSFTMPQQKDIPFANDTHVTAEGIQGLTVSGFGMGTTSYYGGKKIVFGGKEYTTSLSVSSAIKMQNVGMGFIKGFNWVFDIKNNKAYIKKNSLALDTAALVKQPYYAIVNKDALIVRLRIAGNTKYQIGDRIVSVNGQQVNKENLCEMLALLNKTNNWESLNVLTEKLVAKR